MRQNLLSMVQRALNQRHVVRRGAAVEKEKAAAAVEVPAAAAEASSEGEGWSRHRHNINFRKDDRKERDLMRLFYHPTSPPPPF
jgi:hypothetical protein